MMITIFLRRTTGKGEKLLVFQDSSISHMLAEIKETLNPTHQYNTQSDIYFQGRLLTAEDQLSLEEAEIHNNSILHVVEEKEQIERNPLTIRFILRERLIEYEINQDETVQVFKDIVCKDLEIKDEEDLTLSFLGKELNNGKSVRSYRFGQDILISASAVGPVNLNRHKKTHVVSKENQSEESEAAPKIVRESTGGSPLKIKKRTESMNVDPQHVLKTNAVFASVNLKRIDEKIDESRNESQINESEEFSDEKSSEIIEKLNRPEFEKPKLTLESLSKPWPGTQQIIETESIIDDEEEEYYEGCTLELIRTDHKREYAFDCTKEDTFASATALVASLQRTGVSEVKLLINFDEVSKSGISSLSSKAFSSPRSASPKQRKSLESAQILKSFQYKSDNLKMLVVDYASRLKRKSLSFEFEIFAEI